jgi:hypothetical protein
MEVAQPMGVTLMPDKQRSGRGSLIDSLTAEDALAVLRELARGRGKLADAVNDAIAAFLQAVDQDEVAKDVFHALDALVIEDVWDRSGRTRHGYTEPAQAAVDVFEEALEPFIAKVKEYMKLKMYSEAEQYGLGILKGIYDFDQESESEYKEWAEDVPQESFAWVQQIWMEHQRDPQERGRMNERIAAICPAWT